MKNQKIFISIFIFLSIFLLFKISQGEGFDVKFPCIGAFCAFPSEETSSIAAYIVKIYQVALSLGGILAVGAIVIGALIYSLSPGNPQKQALGKDYISSAILGLLLLFGAYVVLQTINPRLVALEEPKVKELPYCDEVQDKNQPCIPKPEDLQFLQFAEGGLTVNYTRYSEDEIKNLESMTHLDVSNYCAEATKISYQTKSKDDQTKTDLAMSRYGDCLKKMCRNSELANIDPKTSSEEDLKKLADYQKSCISNLKNIEDDFQISNNLFGNIRKRDNTCSWFLHNTNEYKKVKELDTQYLECYLNEKMIEGLSFLIRSTDRHRTNVGTNLNTFLYNSISSKWVLHEFDIRNGRPNIYLTLLITELFPPPVEHNSYTHYDGCAIDIAPRFLVGDRGREASDDEKNEILNQRRNELCQVLQLFILKAYENGFTVYNEYQTKDPPYFCPNLKCGKVQGIDLSNANIDFEKNQINIDGLPLPLCNGTTVPPTNVHLHLNFENCP